MKEILLKLLQCAVCFSLGYCAAKAVEIIKWKTMFRNIGANTDRKYIIGLAAACDVIIGGKEVNEAISEMMLKIKICEAKQRKNEKTTCNSDENVV